jgi:hypothetical protein
VAAANSSPGADVIYLPAGRFTLSRGSDVYAMPSDQRGVTRLAGTEVGAVERRVSDPSFASGFEIGSWSGWSAATL